MTFRQPQRDRLHGVLLVDKPPAWTSHDVVAKVRRLSGERRIGHTGTLDPNATGLLVLCLGRATRLAEFMTALPKTYEGEIALGVRTDTDDADGNVLEERPVPAFDEARLRELEEAFTGELLQRPPAYSAVKVDGERSYALARRGEAVELPPRLVTVYELRLRRIAPDRLGIRVRCSAGCYVRALARDIGEALGCGAHLASLARTEVGVFRLSQAHTLDQLAAASAEGRLPELILPPDEGVASYEAAIVTPSRAWRLAHGELIGPSPRPWRPSELARLYDTRGEFIGMGRVLETGHIRPLKVIAETG
ncbi:tRNA pseudouridine synthase B [bacterium HR29]|jgi:tRNA pseudouridine55 synthase|nr:tRNA pseudouridine synthase B [bacterium HR29]